MPSPSSNEEIRLHPAAPSRARRLAGPLADLLFPPFCLLCHERLGEDDQTICLACRDSFQPPLEPICAICGAPWGGEAKRRGCERCPPRPVHFDSARSAALYAGPAAEAVKTLKFRGRVEMAPVLARRMAPLAARHLAEAGPVDWIVPVPLHVLRRLRRGFNQAALISRELSRLLGVPTLEGALARVRRTRQQTLLDPRERRANVERAFAVVDPAPLRGRRILLIDDVFTTGATCNTCARVLKEAGAEAAHVFTFARAV
ncbi:MAG: ComF family protein [Candidatus Sumerlaeota bacterium]|nr:ComF family protein [Candidatus Sumerlaeota bacterium]